MSEWGHFEKEKFGGTNTGLEGMTQNIWKSQGPGGQEGFSEYIKGQNMPKPT